MRQFRRLFIFILCILMLTTTVYAAGSTKSVRSSSVVSSNGSCDVTLTVSIYLDEPADGLTFPLPKNSKNISMNGHSVRTYESGSVLMADLSSIDGIMGDYTMNFHYTISNVLQTVDKKLVMELPLLSGFDYPVQEMEFSVTLPGAISGNPSFSSGYLKNSVDSVLNWNVGNNMITGVTTAALQDRETLTMTLQVSEEMFPGQLIIYREGNPEVIYMAITAALALLYWILMMRCLPIFHQHRTTPPEGLTAGEIGSRLSAAGVDLTMMVFSWAQMGYLRIVPDKYGRVKLEKQMDMGNERTEFEMHAFHALFKQGKAADATGDSYARLCRKVAQTVSGAHEMYRRRAGNIQVFRILCCIISIFCGVCYGMNLALRPTWQTVLSILFAVLGAITAWGVQGGMYRFHIRGKISQYIGLVCGTVWILFGLLAGTVWVGVAAVAAQMLAGLAAAYGGRRSKLGRLHASQILGLRRHLKRVSKEELQQIVDVNPDYFFDMLPYAMALGVARKFARQFGNIEIIPCTYVVTRQERRRSALEWAQLLHNIAEKMDKKQKKLQLKQWTLISLEDFKPVRMPAGEPVWRPSSRSRASTQRRPAQGSSRSHQRSASRSNPTRKRSSNQPRRRR